MNKRTIDDIFRESLPNESLFMEANKDYKIKNDEELQSKVCDNNE